MKSILQKVGTPRLLLSHIARGAMRRTVGCCSPLIGVWLVSFCFLGSHSSHASVVLNVQGGRLMGASNVIVNGAAYTVEFTDVACGGFYPACSNDLFVFQTDAAARAASTALLDQVFLDGPLGAFDTDVWLTNGCVSANGCIVTTPFRLESTWAVVGVQAINAPPSSTYLFDGVDPGLVFWPIEQSGAIYAAGALAKWGVFTSPPPPPPPPPPQPNLIPEPATLALVAAALLGISATRRRRPIAPTA